MENDEPELLENFRTTDRDHRFRGGRLEFLNPTPMQPPVGYKPQPSLFDLVRQQVQQQLHGQMQLDETEDDADDFEMSDDPIDPTSPWENDHIPSLKSMKERTAALEKQLQQEEQQAAARYKLENPDEKPEDKNPIE